ncbi:MAG: phosphohydrolase [Candidatus Cloacimonetes bacterium]|nr:phosphohydrolase [Candidatus Cloacimonadota bacterium]
MKKSMKQTNLEKKLLDSLSGRALGIAEFILNDEEIQLLQDYANTVSIKRLGYNDHGPVHMRKAALYALTMFDLLAAAGIRFNLQTEGTGELEDSRVVVLVASLLHDVGMTVGRASHEYMSLILAKPIIEKILNNFYPEDAAKRVIIRSMIFEGIFGHMANRSIESLEAGLVLVGDGCDMERGRARITSLMTDKPRVGDIHKYSSTAIQKVIISPGEEKPIRILVEMNQSAGFFQVEEVLFSKISFSPVKPYIELYAGVKDSDMMKYL